MTALQILDQVAFCIGYAVIGAVGLLLTVSAAFGFAKVLMIGLQHDDEKRQDD